MAAVSDRRPVPAFACVRVTGPQTATARATAPIAIPHFIFLLFLWLVVGPWTECRARIIVPRPAKRGPAAAALSRSAHPHQRVAAAIDEGGADRKRRLHEGREIGSLDLPLGRDWSLRPWLWRGSRSPRQGIPWIGVQQLDLRQIEAR